MTQPDGRDLARPEIGTGPRTHYGDANIHVDVSTSDQPRAPGSEARQTKAPVTMPEQPVEELHIGQCPVCDTPLVDVNAQRWVSHEEHGEYVCSDECARQIAEIIEHEQVFDGDGNLLSGGTSYVRVAAPE